ncbi:Nucleotidylyl transferase, partial [Marasmius fiardii PR-910]
PVELVFTSNPTWPHPRVSLPRRPLQISVLDSSFNPPTVAHLALANARRPRYHSIDESNAHDYDAKLLLLSVRNADKQLKSTDATYSQRLEMMIRLAQELVTTDEGEGDVPKKHENVAVAIVDEPTFVGKSNLLQKFLKGRTNHPQEFRLTFLLGFDTLERFFAPRYYASNSTPDPVEAKLQMYTSLESFFAPFRDNSRIVCARRKCPPFDPTIPYSLSTTIWDFLTSRSLPFELVKVIDIGQNVWAVSSSDVRNAIGQRDERWKALVPPLVQEFLETENPY